MAIERAFFIPELNPDNPLGGDLINQTDNHLRLIKYVLINNFPEFDEAIQTNGKFWGILEKLFNVLTDGTIFTNSTELPRKIENGKSIPQEIWIKDDGTLISQEPENPVGFIFPSMLKLSQMDSLYGAGKYRLCDGSDCTGSKYSEIFGINKVPNLINPFTGNEKFPRGSKINVGTFSEDKTAPGGLKVTSEEWAHNHNQSHSHGYNIPGILGLYYTTITVPWIEGPQLAPMSITISSDFTLSESPTMEDHMHTHYLGLTGNDPETVPIHFFVNYFIRVN